MATTDQAVLEEIQYHLLETPNLGVSWSALWTVAEVSNYLNRRQDRFIRETGIVQKIDSTVAALASVSRHTIPQDVIDIRSLAWKNQAGLVYPLLRDDSWDLDHGFPLWQTETSLDPPLYYSDTDLPTRTVAIAPPVGVAGLLELLYTYVGATLGNAGALFTVPDDFIPCVKYGVMADMLSKVGRSQDPSRAAYCEARFQEGIEVANIMLSVGFF